jgi:hypothetical protein
MLDLVVEIKIELMMMHDRMGLSWLFTLCREGLLSGMSI